MATGSPNLIPIGKYFSARPGEATNRVVMAVTAGGKPALPGVNLAVTPNMRLVIVGRNLLGYNRALILASNNRTHEVFPKTTTQNNLTFVAFDLPDYGEEKFVFRLRLQSSRPDVADISLDKNFNYAEETEEEKADREKKAAEAAAAQEQAEAAQKAGQDEQVREDFETKQAKGLNIKSVVSDVTGAVLGAAGAVASGAATLGTSGTKNLPHKWEGRQATPESKTTPGSQTTPQKPAGRTVPNQATPGQTVSEPQGGISDIAGPRGVPVARREPTQAQVPGAAKAAATTGTPPKTEANSTSENPVPENEISKPAKQSVSQPAPFQSTPSQSGSLKSNQSSQSSQSSVQQPTAKPAARQQPSTASLDQPIFTPSAISRTVQRPQNSQVIQPGAKVSVPAQTVAGKQPITQTKASQEVKSSAIQTGEPITARPTSAGIDIRPGAKAASITTTTTSAVSAPQGSVIPAQTVAGKLPITQTKASQEVKSSVIQAGAAVVPRANTDAVGIRPGAKAASITTTTTSAVSAPQGSVIPAQAVAGKQPITQTKASQEVKSSAIQTGELITARPTSAGMDIRPGAKAASITTTTTSAVSAPQGSVIPAQAVAGKQPITQKNASQEINRLSGIDIRPGAKAPSAATNIASAPQGSVIPTQSVAGKSPLVQTNASQEINGAKILAGAQILKGVSVTGQRSQASSVSGKVSGAVETTSDITSDISLKTKLSLEQQAKLKQTVNVQKTVSARQTDSLEVNGMVKTGTAEPPQIPVPAQGSQSTAKSSQTTTFKNRKTLALEKEYDAKFSAFQKNAKNLEVKLKRPAGEGSPAAPVKLNKTSADATGTSAPHGEEQTSTENDEGEPNVSEETTNETTSETGNNSGTINNPAAEQEEAFTMPQKLPANLSSQTAAAETTATTTAETSVATAGATEGAIAGAEAGAPGGPPVMIAGALAGAAMAQQGKGKKPHSSEVEKVIAQASKAANGPLLDIAIAVWVAALPTFGLSLLLGAIVGDVLWAFKDKIFEKALQPFLTTNELKSMAKDFVKEIKLSAAVKANIIAMNITVVLFVGIVVVFLLTLTQALCNNFITGGAIYLAGYSNVCDAVKSATSGQPLGTAAGGPLNTNVGSGQCTPLVSGPASQANLAQSCFGQNAMQASMISAAEDGGNQFSLSTSDVCRNDGKVFSVGLFQINLLIHPINDPTTGQSLNCPSVFIKGSPSYIKTDASGKTYYDCSVDPAKMSLYNQCISAAENAQSNIQAACAISSNGTNWNAWSTHTKCGL